MDSLILLGIENLELDWGKQYLVKNHSKLYCKSDMKPADYFYFDYENDSYRTEKKPAYVRKLGDLLRRLELLGYTLSGCHKQYADHIESTPDYCKPIPFESFRKTLASINVANVRVPDEPTNCDPGEFAEKIIFKDREFLKRDHTFASMDDSTGVFYESLDPYITLRLLAENSKNLEKDIIWRFEDDQYKDHNGKTPIYEDLLDADRFLVVTEGSSDSTILSRSLPLVAPDVADFFYFVDMTNNYPFTGTGNVFKFCQGLARIRMQNNILVLLDNDTAGHDVYNRILKLKLPPKMHVATLPDIQGARRFKTLGPTGKSTENVNGKAVSIELFLDFSQIKSMPVIRWTSFNDSVGHYQGELIGKEGYVKSFHNKCDLAKGYDLSKLRDLWAYIINKCASD